MRTVDPYLWSKKVKKPILNLTKPYKFGLEYSPLEVRLRSSLGDALKEFWKNCAVGQKFSADKNYNVFTRWCYLLFMVASLVTSLPLLLKLWDEYQGVPPLIVNELMEDDVLNNITFPAVAICSNSIISRPALDRYAQHLFSLDRNQTYSVTTIKSNLMAFGALFNMAFTPIEHDFMKWLAQVAKETNVTKIMYELAPACRSLLVRCAWHARSYRCAELFSRRITPLGFCCVFNSRYMSIDRHSTIYQLNETGIAAGLAVVARENPDDYAFVKRPGNEFMVLLFDGDNYPSMISGVVRAFIVQRNSSSLITLKTYTQYSSYDLNHYTKETRGCRLPAREEGKFDVGAWSTCLMLCQRDVAIALCNCAPFTMPSYDGEDVPECSLEHLDCLAKYREKFYYFFPGATSDESLNEEAVNSLYCIGPEACMPDCTRQLHTARVTMIRHDRDNVVKTLFLKGLDMTNATIIRIFYDSDTQKMTIIETNNQWYEIIGFLCCELVFVLSVTVVNLFEIVYFCTIRWIHHYRRRKQLFQVPTIKNK